MPACIPESASAYVRQEPSRTAARPGQNAGDGGALGAKLVTVFGSNPAVGLPTHLATIVLLDSMTGELLAVMDGRYITEARTAAVSAVSTKLLAREGAGVLAMIGSGVQARSHARRDRPRASAPRRARLEPERRTPRRLRAGDAAAHPGADHAVRVGPRRPRRRRHRRARHIGARAGRPQRMDRRRRACLRRRRVQARSARNGLGAGVARASVRGFEKRRVDRSGRRAARDEGRRREHCRGAGRAGRGPRRRPRVRRTK